MDGWLKQSVAITLRIGPFLDSVDGNTQETALTIAQADVVLSKVGGALTAKNDATSCTHDTKGYYSCPLNETDTGTLGLLKLAVHVAGALAVWHTFMVLPAQVWDSLFGTDKLDVAVVEQANIDFGALQKTSLNAEVVDAIGIDTIAEMAQGIPPATPTLKQALMYLYMALRDETNTTATLITIKNDAGVVICKGVLSDDATTFVKGEMVSGP